MSWNVELEYCAADVDSEKLEDFADHLAAEGAACRIGGRKLSVMLVVKAPTLPQALDAGIAQLSESLARAKVNANIVAARVLSPGELERELANATIPQLVGVAEVADLLEVSRPASIRACTKQDVPAARR